MLKNTFCHIRGVSSNTEKILWEHGILDWDLFLENFENIDFLSLGKKNIIRDEIFFSLNHLENNNLNYFKEKLNSKEHFRLIDFGKIAFVDIETTGLSKYSHDITLIGIYDGKKPYIYVKGKNLEKAYDHLSEFDIVVTFNGKSFDLPFIEYKSNRNFDLVHLDLRYLLKELGFSGGLKNIEKSLGICRDEQIANVDGFEAVRLWRDYQRGNLEAFEKLLKYNQEDIVNLKFLLDFFLKEKFKVFKELKVLN